MRIEGIRARSARAGLWACGLALLAAPIFAEPAAAQEEGISYHRARVRLPFLVQQALGGVPTVRKVRASDRDLLIFGTGSALGRDATRRSPLSGVYARIDCTPEPEVCEAACGEPYETTVDLLNPELVFDPETGQPVGVQFVVEPTPVTVSSRCFEIDLQLLDEVTRSGRQLSAELVGSFSEQPNIICAPSTTFLQGGELPPHVGVALGVSRDRRDDTARRLATAPFELRGSAASTLTDGAMRPVSFEGNFQAVAELLLKSAGDPEPTVCPNRGVIKVAGHATSTEFRFVTSVEVARSESIPELPDPFASLTPPNRFTTFIPETPRRGTVDGGRIVLGPPLDLVIVEGP